MKYMNVSYVFLFWHDDSNNPWTFLEMVSAYDGKMAQIWQRQVVSATILAAWKVRQ